MNIKNRKKINGVSVYESDFKYTQYVALALQIKEKLESRNVSLCEKKKTEEPDEKTQSKDDNQQQIQPTLTYDNE